MFQASLQRDVGEGAVAIVLEKVVKRLITGPEALETSAVDEEDVEPAVIIVVVERDATARGFEQVFVFVFAAEDGDGVEPGFFGDVNEGGAEFGRRRWGLWVVLREDRKRLCQREHIRKAKDERAAAERT